MALLQCCIVIVHAKKLIAVDVVVGVSSNL